MRAGYAEWTDNRAGTRPGRAVLAEAWRARELVGYFALRDLRVRYKQAILGVLWAVVQPLATVVVFTFVFGRLAGVDSGDVPYPLLTLSGVVLWAYFSSVVTQASDVLVRDSALITKVYFPRLTAPLASLLPPLVDMAVTLCLLGLLCLFYGFLPPATILALPLVLVLLMATALGVGLWLSALNVRYRDIRHAVLPMMQVLLFVSPVGYPSNLVGESGRYLYALNPMAGVIDLGRWSLLGEPWPGWPLAVSVGVCACVLASGLWYFTRAERGFADVI